MHTALTYQLQTTIAHVSTSNSTVEASNKQRYLLATQTVSAAYKSNYSEKFPTTASDNNQPHKSSNLSLEINNVETTRALHVP